MSHILDLFKRKGFTYYQSERFNLDNFFFDPYQDEGEEFEKNKIFETENKSGKFVNIKIRTNTSYFKYFLDGSRLTYKIAEMETTNGKFMPIVAGQLSTGVCKRDDGKVKKHDLKRKNILMVYSQINKEDFQELQKEVAAIKINDVPFSLDTYRFESDLGVRPENRAIATIHQKMLDMEIQMLDEMVKSNILKPDEMLVIDGSLQFPEQKADERLFHNVIGISKSFNPNLQDVLKKQSQQIATVLVKLKFGQRTPVYRYPTKKSSGRVIGAWYLRIRPENQMRNPLDGIVKVEKIAVTNREKEDGFESGLIDNISQSILLERNVTCYGKDTRWPNHIYPIYLTETMIKQSFLSSIYFLNLF